MIGVFLIIIVFEGFNVYYFNSKNFKLVFGVVVWIKDKKLFLYFDIKFLFKKVNGDLLIFFVGKSYIFLVGIIKVYKVIFIEVIFMIYFLNNLFKSIIFKEGESGGVVYVFLNMDFKYYDFVYVEFFDIIFGKLVKFNVYMLVVFVIKILVSCVGGLSLSLGLGILII